MQSDLQNQIKSFKKSNLAAAETVDKSGPVGVVAQAAAPPPPSALIPPRPPPPQPPQANPIPRVASQPMMSDEDDDFEQGKSDMNMNDLKKKGNKGRRTSKANPKPKKGNNERRRSKMDVPSLPDMQISSAPAAAMGQTGLDDFSYQIDGPMLGWLYVLAFLAGLDFSIVFPSSYGLVRSLGGSVTYYGIVFAMFSVAQFCASFFLGALLDNRPLKEILLLSSLNLMVGNLLYSRANSNDTMFLLIVGRVLCGAGAAIVTIGYAHIARVSNEYKRLSRFTFFRWLEIAPAVVAPAIGAGLTHASFNAGAFDVNHNNSCSFFMVFVFAVYSLAIIVKILLLRRQIKTTINDKMFRSIEEEVETEDMLRRRMQLAAASSDNYAEDGSSTPYASLGAAPASGGNGGTVFIQHRFASKDAFVLLLIFASMVISFWAFEASVIPVVVKADWDITSNYLLFLYIGVVISLSYGAFTYFGLEQKGTRLLITALLTMCIGSVTLTQFDQNKSMPTWQICVASGFLASGFCIGSLQVPLMYSKLIGAKMEDLGVKMTWFFAVIALARFVGPFWGAVAYEIYGINLIAHSSAILLILAVFVGFCSLPLSETLPNTDPSAPLNRQNLRQYSEVV
eukprot:TRINITY_DN16853_c0_g2_i1.p1 TRINITY_DN16853_c0_g2~~TRINITY_DN16853_c0_g2_i1.p1  ORF type:complete len:623 (+),score=152.81 TRINITY_DN16853_c0_g2_i1:64-1932(+)